MLVCQMRTTTVSDLELLQLRAKCLYAMGDLENAIKHVQSALRSDPDNTTSKAFYRRLRDLSEKREGGNTAFKEGRYQEAIDQWTHAIDMDPHNKSIVSKLYCNRANAKSKLKHNESAVLDCNKAVHLDPDYVKAYLRRADCNMAIGGPDRIQRAIE